MALFSGSKYVTLSFIFPIMQQLINNLQNNYLDLDDITIQAVHNTILTDIEKRLKVSYKYSIMASFFDPQFKSLKFIDERAEIIEDLHQEYQQLSLEMLTNQQIQTPTILQQDNSYIENDFNKFI
ncbi:34618_t:CDS:2, partial [Racocetra persica]